MARKSENHGMEVLRARLEEWRQAKPSSFRIPEEIWEMAVEQARRDGVGRVSKELGLSHGRLKARLASLPRKIEKEREVNGGGFVELINLAGCGQMRVEVNRPDGCQLRIEIGADRGVEAAPVVRAFLG